MFDDIDFFNDFVDMFMCGFFFSMIIGFLVVVDYIVFIILDCMYVLNVVLFVRCVGDFLEG